MIKYNYFNRLDLNRCSILLKEHESFFIYNRLLSKLKLQRVSEDNLKDTISDCLHDFHEGMENRYFSRENIPKISESLSKKIIKIILNEEIGRGRISGFDQITSQKVSRKNGNVYIEKGVDTFGDNEIMYIEDEEGNKRTAKVDSPDHAAVVSSQIKLKTIAKNNV